VRILPPATVVGKRATSVLLFVPGLRTHGGEKLLHRFGVAIEELAIQIPWVPINKNAAEIEHGDGAFSHEEKNSNWENDSGRGFSIQRVCLSVEVSADGKTLTMTMHIPGRSALNVRVFDRE